VDAHLLKPLQQEELLQVIYRVMSRAHEDRETRRQEDEERDRISASASPSLPVSSSPRPLRILVAEDNEFNAQLLEQLLVRRGHRVRVAKNGREALVLLGIGDQQSEVGDQRSEDRDQKSEVRDQRSEISLPIVDLTSPLILRPLISDFRPLTADP
jgi:two-component system, sensor histidine kinase and response regulator